MQTPIASRPAHRTPTFRELDRAECEAVLARNTVGRLAFSHDNRVDIEPLHFVFEGGWLYGRTSTGDKITALAHRPWVALEIDEIRDTFDWVSVVVHGAFYRFRPDGSRAERAGYDRAVAALRRLLPETLAMNDPVPFREIVFGVHVDHLTGREATST